GTYRFTVRAATNAVGKKMHLEVDGIAMPSIELPNTGSLDSYQLAHLGEIPLKAGPHTLRLVFESPGGLNVDWFFLKRK
ncbi:MAG TPA: carbohydrate-binding domain-containing protein, partial [Aquabacterium sp.]|nr:carbohydrate-binding domain-containing protein [Aquabacterium sp.]